MMLTRRALISRVPAALLGAVLTLATLGAHASPLDDAKGAGEVGEQADGYLGIVHPPGSPAIQALVNSINAERRERYQAIADRNGITLAQVEALAGKKAIEKTESGRWIRLPDNGWIPK